MRLSILTPEGLAFDAWVDRVKLPGSDGSIGVLPRHAEMIADLAEGDVRYVPTGERGYRSIRISEGTAQVGGDQVRILCFEASVCV